MNRRSTIGYYTFLGGNLVIWKNKKQSVVARSRPKQNFEQWLKEYVNCYG